jgi:hypothetical protein
MVPLKDGLDQNLEKGFDIPSLQLVPWYCLLKKRMDPFECVSITVGWIDSPSRTNTCYLWFQDYWINLVMPRCTPYWLAWCIQLGAFSRKWWISCYLWFQDYWINLVMPRCTPYWLAWCIQLGGYSRKWWMEDCISYMLWPF